jgi:hypothetical protein
MFDLEKNVHQQPEVSDDFLKEVLSRRIKSTDKIKSAKYLMQIDGVNKISKDNISGFIGKAKSRKSFAVTMFAAALAGGLNLYNKFKANAAYKVLYADTEQSADDVQLITKRVHHLIGNEETFFMYAFKPFNPTERIKAIQLMLDEHRPDVLIIDGLKDLVYNILDPVEATNIFSTLQKWNVYYDVHISCILHQNKADGNARGHIGTELDNKSQVLFRITQDENDKSISEFKEVFGRGKGTEAFNFFVNNDYADFGIPEVCESVHQIVNLDKDPF